MNTMYKQAYAAPTMEVLHLGELAGINLLTSMSIPSAEFEDFEDVPGEEDWGAVKDL